MVGEFRGDASWFAGEVGEGGAEAASDGAHQAVVHRATAARRLVAARDELASATRRQLEEQLGLAPRDVDSVMMLIRSRLGDAADVLK